MTILKKIILLLLLHICMPSKILLAQTADSLENKSYKRVRILPFPSLGYAPETRLAIGGVLIFTIRGKVADSTVRPTTIKSEATITQNKQLIISSSWNAFFKREKYYWFGDISYNKFPEAYWGIGNFTFRSDSEMYDAKRFEINSTFLVQLKPNIFFGPRYQFQYIFDILSRENGLLRNTNSGNGGISSGLGFTTSWDTRTNNLNAQNGHLISFTNIYFQPLFGSRFTFTNFKIDVRKYFPLAKEHTIAWQGVGVFNTGEPPFRMLALLGGEYDLRGYYQGRFRDKQYTYSHLEYRFPIYWRVGGAVFTGAGEVAPTPGKFSLNGLKPMFGGGLRFKIDRKENVNLRFDVAHGERTEFYVGYGEAF